MTQFSLPPARHNIPKFTPDDLENLEVFSDYLLLQRCTVTETLIALPDDSELHDIWTLVLKVGPGMQSEVSGLRMDMHDIEAGDIVKLDPPGHFAILWEKMMDGREVSTIRSRYISARIPRDKVRKVSPLATPARREMEFSL